MKSFFYTFLFLSVFSVLAQAQQASQYSLYMLNPMRWNPAYAGLDQQLSLNGFHRQQWVGLDGSPSSQLITADMPLQILSGGIGLQFENDRIGASHRMQAGLSYNFQKSLGSGVLSIGAKADWIQWTLDGNVLRTPDGVYFEPGTIDHRDDLLSIAAESANTTTFGAGVYYKSPVIEGGISVENISEPTLGLNSFNLPLKRTYYASLGAQINISETLSFHPSTWLRSDAIETQVDFSALFRYNNNIFGGASLRGYTNDAIDAIAIIAGFRLSENLQLAYAYDIGLSNLRSVHSGSHEIGISYDLEAIGKGVPPPIIYHPRTMQ